jgi:hypothetical protein
MHPTGMAMAFSISGYNPSLVERLDASQLRRAMCATPVFLRMAA